MTIGDALAEGRRQAGLTVTQVSQRTCIRETIIRGIERDDFSGCGGDFYARGHIRSIARAVETDPEPLIDEYDATMGAPQGDQCRRCVPARHPGSAEGTAQAELDRRDSGRPGRGSRRFRLRALQLPSATVADNRRPVQTANTKPKPPPKSSAVVQHRPRRLNIKLTATQDSWVVLTSLRTGQTIFAGMVYAGQSLRWYEKHASGCRSITRPEWF